MILLITAVIIIAFVMCSRSEIFIDPDADFMADEDFYDDYDGR